MIAETPIGAVGSAGPVVDVTATAPRVDTRPLRYANVWEDPRVLRRALRVRPGDRVLSIASAGDNAFALLVDDPAVVVAVDMSATQLALCALKKLAIGKLDGPQLRRFLGFDDDSVHVGAGFRRGLYRALRRDLPAPARAWCDAHDDVIAKGVVRCGRLERYFHAFSRGVLPLVQRKKTVERLLACTSLDEQRAVFADWDHAAWRTLFRLFFSRALLKRARDPEFLAHVGADDVAGVFLRRAERALTETPIHDNFMIASILRGGPVTSHGAPDYLLDEHLDVVRGRLDRLELVLGDLRQVAQQRGAFDAHNLSDIFEYMPQAAAQATWSTLAASSKPSARFCWWNLLVDRRPRSAASGGDALVVDDALSQRLHAEDRGFFYGSVVVAQPS